MSKTTDRFKKDTISFLEKAGRQKRADWLEKNISDYEVLVKNPLTHLAKTVALRLSSLAPDYHFPQKGLARIKRMSSKVDEKKGYLFKDWVTYHASRPRTSRFEHNPNLFFLINSEDKEDPVLVAGGLYMPSSRQTRALREALSDPTKALAFDKLFASKEFKRSFPHGFSDEKISSRPTRGYDPLHPRMSWLRLQAFFVWRSYSMREFTSSDFASLVAQDFTQVLRLNRLLDAAIEGRTPTLLQKPKQKATSLDPFMERLKDIQPVRHKEDF